MRDRRDAAIRLFKIMLVAVIAIPIAMFGYAALLTYRSTFAHADERLLTSLDVLSEQAGKIFQSVDLAFAGVDALVGGMSDDEIRASEQVIHGKLKELDDAVAAVDGIWVFDKNAHPLATSRMSPAPRDLDISDREYFQAQLKDDAGLFVSPLLTARVTGRPIITVSRRGAAGEDRPIRVVVIAVKPEVFTEFYNRLARDSAASFSLVKQTGAILARFPAPPGGATRFAANSRFIQTVMQQPDGGIITTPSIDASERRIGYRKLGYHDLYVSDGIPVNAIYAEWLETMGSHLIFGAPATALLFTLVLLTMRRTVAFYEEAERRELAEQALRQSQKMEAVGQLTGGVAHDFNNLLTIIIGNLGIAKRGVVEARAERALANALTGAERAAQLTQRLLAFARRQPLNPRAIDANKLIVSMSDLLTRTLGENIELQTIGGAGLWNVEADASELEASLLNLAVNARDAMPQGGKLTIETSNAYLDEEYCRHHANVTPGQYVMVAVTDNGTGMSIETIDKAFEPFFTTKETGKGTGLGLSQVYGFTKQSGGHVKIYSEPGDGTTIKIYLPRYDGDEAAVALPEGNAERGNGETILIVEDDEGVRQYAAEILRDLNYSIIEAKDAASAIRLLDADKPFDLLLTDVVLPGKNGRELATEVERRRPGTKIIFMTGYSRNAIVHQGRLDPGIELISKPLIEGVLARRIRQVLDAPVKSLPVTA
jgi:two-component system NtrC family sensor kinase